METRISSYSLMAYAAITGSLLLGILLVAPGGFTSTSHAQITPEDFGILQESVNDAREAIHTNDSVEAMEELDTAENALLRITNATQTQAEPPEVEVVTTATPENQTTPESPETLSTEDSDTFQESVNDAREAIHTNDTAGAIDELTSTVEDLTELSNQTTSSG